MIKKIIIAMLFATVVFSSAAFASEVDSDFDRWAKLEVRMGTFWSVSNSDVRFGSALGLDIDVEDLFGIDVSTNVFRASAAWRFTESRRHCLEFNWFSLHRTNDRSVLQDFSFEDRNNDIVYVKAGTQVASLFNIDIYQLSYNYSFFQDNRFDVAAKVGLFIMPIEFGLTTSGLVEEKFNETLVAPLPSFGLHSYFAFTPRWYLRLGTEFFYLEVGEFRGGLFDTQAAVEYRRWEHLGIGLGFEKFGLDLEADGKDYLNIDFRGKIEYGYLGLHLYANLFF